MDAGGGTPPSTVLEEATDSADADSGMALATEVLEAVSGIVGSSGAGVEAAEAAAERGGSYAVGCVA